MPDYQTLLLDRQDDILLVTINRPEALNAINATVMQELGELFDEDIEAMTGLRGVILRGAGEKSFVAGADIKEFVALSATQAREMSARGQWVFDRIEGSHVPVIAAVQGFALGAGCELAMACHLRVAGERARFGQPEVNLGLVPGYGGTQRLVTLIGRGKALEFLLTADMIGADEALKLGLVNHVVPAGEEVAKSLELLGKMRSKAPIALRQVIMSVNAYGEPNRGGYAAEVEAFGRCAETEDFTEGATAFVEKRPANFQGR